MTQLIKNMNMQDYQNTDALSKSMLALLGKKSPKHAYEKYMNPDNKKKLNLDSETPHYDLWRDNKKKHFDFGTVLHCYALEQENMDKYVLLIPDDINLRKKSGRIEMDEILAKASGKSIITMEDMDLIKKAAKNILDHPMTGSVLNAVGFVESTILWSHAGVDMKCRPDFVNPDMDLVVDVKTAAEADPRGFMFAARKFNYHLSHAITAEGYEVHFKRPLKAYIYLVVEKDDLLSVVYYNSEPDCLLEGQTFLEKFRPIYKMCREKKNWNVYGNEILPLNTGR